MKIKANTSAPGVVVLLFCIICNRCQLGECSDANFFLAGEVVAPSKASAGTIYSNISRTHMVYSPLECAAKCAGEMGCTSVNLEVPSNGSVSLEANPGSPRIQCSTIRSDNWTANFTMPGNGFDGKFYLRKPWAPPQEEFFLKKAVFDPVNITEQPPLGNVTWKTDCASWAITRAMLVGLRNFNNGSSLSLDEIKCRQFYRRTPFDLDFDLDEAPIVVNLTEIWWPAGYGQNVRNLTCPNGWVITAIFDSGPTSFTSAEFVKCRQPKLPWVVDNADCRKIFVFRYDAAQNVISPMNDPLKTGTADSLWGAQCGTRTTVEAMTQVWLRASDYGKFDTILCCRMLTI